MMHLLRSELFRLRKRPQTWILAIIMVGAAGAFYAAMTAAAFILSDPTHVEENLQPGRVFQSGMQLVVFTAYVLASVQAAGLIGNEFGWNTIRPLLARASSRNAMLTAKWITVLLATTTLFVIGFVAALMFSTVGSLVVGSFEGLGATAVADMVLSMVRVLVSQLPYSVLAFSVALFTRSNAAGIAVGIGMGILEPAVWGLLSLVTGAFDSIRKFGLEYPSILLFNMSAGIEHVSAWEAWRAVIVLCVWSVLMVIGTYMVFNRRDVTSG